MTKSSIFVSHSNSTQSIASMLRSSLLLFCVFNMFSAFGQGTFKQAQEKYSLKKYTDAASILDKLILKNDKDTQSYLLRGKCFFNLKQAQNAYDDFSKYIDLEPKDGLAYLYKGIIMESTGRYFDAINDLNSAIKYGKDTVLTSGYFHRGSCYMSINNKSQAYNDMFAAYKRNPAGKYIRLNYATSLCNIDSIDEGIKIFKELICEDDKNAIAYQNIGYFSMKREQYDTALFYFNKTLAINPKSALTYNNRGFLKYKMGKNEEALNDVNTAMKLDKSNSFAYKNRALISMAQNKTDAACEDLKIARSLGFTEKYGNEVDQLIQKNCNKR